MRLRSAFKGVGLFAFVFGVLTSLQAVRAEVGLDGSFVAGANCTRVSGTMCKEVSVS